MQKHQRIRHNEKGEIEIVKPAETNETCEKCGEPMIVKKGRYGEFLACSGYPNCKNTKPMPTGVKCPNCDGELTKKRSLKGRFFFGCTNYPKCEFTARFLTKEQKEEAQIALEKKAAEIQSKPAVSPKPTSEQKNKPAKKAAKPTKKTKKKSSKPKTKKK